MLSVVICVYNEESNLPRVITSAKSVANEIVVVDTESTDKSIEIAKKLGCKVYKHKNTGIIEPVRNFAVSKATGDWILLLDADEELSPELVSEIVSVLKTPKGDYYRIPRQNIIFNKWIKSSHWWPDFTVRLYKKGKVTWRDEIHSVPKVTGSGFDMVNPLIHQNFQTISQFIQKLNNYTDFQSKELIENGYVFHWTDLLHKPFAEFLTQYFARNGISDGLHGLVLSILQSISEFIVYTKIWQYHRFREQQINATQFKSIIKQFAKDYRWWEVESRINKSNIIVATFLKIIRKLS